MKINQAGRVGAMTTALVLGGCGNGAQDTNVAAIALAGK